MFNAQTGRGVALRVQIDNHDSVAMEGEGDREVHGARGLTDAALLVRDSKDPALRRARHHDVATGVEHLHGALGFAREWKVVVPRGWPLGGFRCFT